MATTVQRSNDGLGIDTSDFAKFAKALRKTEPAVAKILAQKLRAVGMIVADDAKGLAGEASRTIPPSVKVRVSGATVSVVAGGNGIPFAGLMELGNKGNKTTQATFRHPVFGDATNGGASGPWVDQPTHPYLLPSLMRNYARVEQAAVDALDEVVQQVTTEFGSG